MTGKNSGRSQKLSNEPAVSYFCENVKYYPGIYKWEYILDDTFYSALAGPQGQYMGTALMKRYRVFGGRQDRTNTVAQKSGKIGISDKVCMETV